MKKKRVLWLDDRTTSLRQIYSRSDYYSWGRDDFDITIAESYEEAMAVVTSAPRCTKRVR